MSVQSTPSGQPYQAKPKLGIQTKPAIKTRQNVLLQKSRHLLLPVMRSISARNRLGFFPCRLTPQPAFRRNPHLLQRPESYIRAGRAHHSRVPVTYDHRLTPLAAGNLRVRSLQASLVKLWLSDCGKVMTGRQVLYRFVLELCVAGNVGLRMFGTRIDGLAHGRAVCSNLLRGRGKWLTQGGGEVTSSL